MRSRGFSLLPCSCQWQPAALDVALGKTQPGQRSAAQPLCRQGCTCLSVRLVCCTCQGKALGQLVECDWTESLCYTGGTGGMPA